LPERLAQLDRARAPSTSAYAHHHERNDPRFATPAVRRQRWDALRPLLTEWLSTSFSSADEALRTLNAVRLPAAPVLSPRETEVLGYTPARLDELRRAGAIAEP
jgi:crotonobetainyl-CoA:carnitine CoA-transferase CaiB-like acyl-CoA transferase